LAGVAIGGLPLSFISAVTAGLSTSIIPHDTVIPDWLYPIEFWTMLPWRAILDDWTAESYGSELFPGIVVISKWINIAILFLIGAFFGYRQRLRRSRAWEAEDHNQKFMHQVGLSEHENGELTDTQGNKYRVQYKSKDCVELFAIGRRNRRGYLTLDSDGKMTEWSGLVTKS
jgi:hypothetical protein